MAEARRIGPPDWMTVADPDEILWEHVVGVRRYRIMHDGEGGGWLVDIEFVLGPGYPHADFEHAHLYSVTEPVVDEGAGTLTATLVPSGGALVVLSEGEVVDLAALVGDTDG